MRPFPSDQRIIDCLAADYGIEIVTLTFLPGVEKDTAVYKAESKGKSSYFVKLKRGCQLGFSTSIVELLHDAGIQQIIHPLKSRDGRLTHPIENCTLVVYPFIEGTDGFNLSLTDNQWLTLGIALRQVHEIDLPAPLKNQIRKETFSPKWRDAVRELYANIENKRYAHEMVTLLKEKKTTVNRLIERAEQLAQKLQNEPHSFVLCHSDIHGGNVLLKETDALYIVDWDDPILAPKECDLMFIGGGVGNIWNEEREKALFYKGYGKTKINKEILAYYRQERIVKDIAEFAQQLLSTTEGGQNRPEIFKHFAAMFDPNGVVDIAIKTDTQKL